MRYNGKLVVVTGVGREGQVGEFLASAFAAEGARVVAVDRDSDALSERVSELRARGFDASGEACDLTSAADAGRLAERVRALGSGVHALVNAAGGFGMSGPVADSDPRVWERMRAINFDTAYLATRALLPLLREAKGAVCYFASAAVLPGEKAAGMSAYVAAKSAVMALARAVAQEERDHGVRTFVLAPTAMRTAANMESMSESVRYVEREEVAELLLHLCGERTGALSGQVLRLG